MSIIYNSRYHTHRHDILDGLTRLGGMVVFATSIMIFAFALFNWSMQ